jgi:hypothetical protein
MTSTPGQRGANKHPFAVRSTPRRPGSVALQIRGGAALSLSKRPASLAPLAPAWRSSLIPCPARYDCSPPD